MGKESLKPLPASKVTAEQLNTLEEIVYDSKVLDAIDRIRKLRNIFSVASKGGIDGASRRLITEMFR